MKKILLTSLFWLILAFIGAGVAAVFAIFWIILWFMRRKP